MYKLTYKGQFVDGFDADQVVGNLAQLLNLKPKAVRLAFLSERPSVIKMLDSASEVERWCAAFQEAGVYLDVVGIDAPDADSIANQIELELELHQLDTEDEEPDERLFLIRKTVALESEPQTFANQPLATRPISDYPVSQAEPPQATAAVSKAKVAKPTTASKAGPGHGAAVNGRSVNGSPVNGSPVNGSAEVTKAQHVNGKVNGSHASIAAAAPGAIAISPPATQATPAAKPIPDDIQETAVHELSVAQIDALAAQQTSSSVDITELSDLVEPDEPKQITPPVVAGQGMQPQDEFLDSGLREAAFEDDIPDALTLDAGQPTGDAAALDEMELHGLQSAAEQDEDLHEDVNFHKSHFVWGMLVILLAIITTAGTILWLKRSTWAPVTVAPQELKITDAIASSSLFGLLHADVDRLQLLSPSTEVFASLAEPKPGFWTALARDGIDVKQQADDVWLGVYGQNGQSKPLWVLQGQFPAEAWREWLKKNYILDSDSPEGIIFSSIDEHTCEKSPVLSASISGSQIVLGAPELVAAFNGRLQAGAPAEKNLKTWAKGYGTQIVSAVLFHPGLLPEGTAAMALGKLSLPAEPIQGIYLGLEPKMFPPAVEFNAILASDNAQFIADAAHKLTAATATAKTTIATDWPETLPFYERIKFVQAPGELHAHLNLDAQAPQKIQLWFSSLVERALAADTPAAVVTEERLENNPPVFTNLASAELPAFASVKHFNEAFIAQTSSGPFGLGIRTLEETDQGLAINLDVNAFNLPNLGKENDSVMLRITDIVDHQDKSLLADTGGGCGGIKQPSAINLVYQGNAMDNGQMVSFTGLQGTKQILLPAGIALTSVGAVKGVISQQLAVEVERVNLNGPLAGKTLDLHGVQLRFLSAEPGRLHFLVSGNSSALLQVNALNEDGKLLASSNAIRGDSIYPEGKSIRIDYQGKIAAADIIVASKVEQKHYDFSIARLFPPAKPFDVQKAEPAYLTAVSLPALDKDSPPNDVVYPYQSPRQTIAAGPALIALNELTISDQQFSLVTDVYTRNSHPLVGQLSAVRLVLSEVEDASGNLHSVDHQMPIAMEHMGGNWVDGKFEPDPSRPWLRGVMEMRDRPLPQGGVVALWGKLVFLATENPVQVKVPFQFGMHWNSNGGVISLRRWEAGRLFFDVEGNFPELMAVKALDDMGVAISQPAVQRSSFGKNTIELEVKQIPETIEFSIARTQNPKEFPVEIRVLQ